MGEHDGKPGVVADGADIAEVIGEALELRQIARGGISIPSATSTARAKAKP
jgi:hypothetical protein